MRSNPLPVLCRLALVLTVCACADNPAVQFPAATPPNVFPPAGEIPYFSAIHYGGANYVCAVSPEDSSVYQWLLLSTDQNLTDESWTAYHGRVLAGPVWEARDQSTVTGKLIATADQDDRYGRSPWQLFRAVSTTGAGQFSMTTSILHTGTCDLPVQTCSPTMSGRDARANCSGRYRFYRTGR
jgi:hypothetical protein